jgi:hypothetical protein
MYFSHRAAQVRNISVAGVNGAITLGILLVAPLGLAAVIVNTLMVTIATYATATAADLVVQFLQGDAKRVEVLSQSRKMRPTDSHDLTQR